MNKEVGEGGGAQKEPALSKAFEMCEITGKVSTKRLIYDNLYLFWRASIKLLAESALGITKKAESC